MIPETGTTATWRPFPTEVLPTPAQSLVQRAAASMCVDPAFCALPALIAAASAIGSVRRIQLKQGWYEPCIKWGAIIAPSGAGKTAPGRLSIRPLQDMQGRLLDEHSQRAQLHEAEQLRYEADLRKWKSKPSGDPPEKPEPPSADRVLVSDVTVEGLAPILAKNPRGLLLYRDELAGWIGSFDRYSRSRGGDAPNWLSMHSGESITVDRKTGDPRTIYVERANVCVCGTIQPGTLRRALSAEYRDAGLAARLLVAMPPYRRKVWTDDGIPPEIEAEYALLIERLRDLQPDASGDPVLIRMDADAKAAFVSFYNAHAIEQADLIGDHLGAAFAKLEAYCARFALLIHSMREAAGESVGDFIDIETMRRAITLTGWFSAEARRVYHMLESEGGSEEEQRLIDWLLSRGGDVSVNELYKSSRRYESTGDARSELDILASRGIGSWYWPKPGPNGGRPSERFQLHNGATETDTPVHDAVSGGFGISSANGTVKDARGRDCEVIE